MISSVENYFFQKLAASKKSHPVYILPTLDGLKVIVLNLLLLIIGLVYANNYILLFNFILFCLFLSSMFYTHFNLNKLSLASFKLAPLFEGENSKLILRFSSESNYGHYFLKAILNTDHFHITQEKVFDIDRNNQLVILNVEGGRRGRGLIDSFYIETRFPFNFFRCFTFYSIQQEVFTYPARINLQVHMEVMLDEKNQNIAEDFELKNYQQGDSLKRVDWKKFAQSQKMFIRHRDTQNPSAVVLVMDEKINVEDSLRSLCYALHYHSGNHRKVGLKLNNDVLIMPENSNDHLSRCLEQLAIYAN